MSSKGNDFKGLSLENDDWISDVTGMTALITKGEVASDSSELKSAPGRRIFVTAKVPVAHVERSASLIRRGFVVVDTAISLEWTPALVIGASSVQHPPQSLYPCDVREAEAEDASAVATLAGRAFVGSRFHLDPDFPNAQARRIKTEWARNLALRARGDGCLVAVQNEQVVGFLGFLKCDIGVSSFVIDLIGVDPDAHRKGVGKSLIIRLLNDAARAGRAVTASTQSANVNSVRLYETLGFRYTGATQVLHAHDQREQTG